MMNITKIFKIADFGLIILIILLVSLCAGSILLLYSLSRTTGNLLCMTVFLELSLLLGTLDNEAPAHIQHS